jgi:hypothetical protein
LDEELIRDVRKIPVERGTTLGVLVRAYLEELARENASSSESGANGRR